MIAGTLEIQLLANMARLQKDMDEAKRTVGGAMNAISGFADQARAALGAIGGALSIGAFAGMIKGAIDAADNLNDLSKSTGIAVVQLAGLKLAAKQSGGDLEGIASSINKLSVAMGKDAERFAKIGVTAKEPMEAFKQLSQVFSAIEDPQLRAAMGAAALGKSWASAAPLLSEGSEKIQEMVDKGMLLSAMSQDAANASDEFNDRVAELQTAIGGTAIKIATGLLPLITALAEDMTDAADKANGLSSSFNPLNETFRALIVLGGNVSFVLKGIGTDIGGMAAQLALFASGDFKRGWAIGDMMEADAEKARAAFDAWESKMMSAGTAVVATAQAAKDASGKLTDAQTANIKAFAEQTDAIKTSAASDLALKAQESFIKGLQKEHDILVMGTQQAKLHEAALLGITGAKLKSVQAMLTEIDTIKAATKAATDRAAQRKAEEDGISAYALAQTQAYNAAVKSSQDALLAAQAEYDQYGMSKSQIAEITLLTLQSAQAKYTDGSEGYNAAQKQIDAQRQLIDVLKKTEIRAEWKSIFESIDRTAHDTFISIFDSGKSASDRLRDTFKNGILEFLYQMTVKKWVFNISANVGGASNTVAQAAQSGSSILGGSGGGGLSSLSSLMSGGAALGNFAGGFSSGISAFGNLAATGGNLSAGFTALGAGNIAGGLGSLAGTLGPYALAAMAIAAIVKNTKGETRGGGQYGYSFDGFAQNNRRPGMSVAAAPGTVAFLEGPSGGEIGGDSVRNAIAATVQGINATLKSVGSSAALTGFQAALETSEKGRGGVFAGGMLNTGVAFGESGAGDNYRGTLFERTSTQSPDAKTAVANFSLDLKQATIQALQAATDLPKSIYEQLRGIDAEALADDAASKLLETINSQIVAVAEFKDAIATLPFDGLRDLSFDTAAALLKFTGGIQGIAAQLASFDQNFYSEAERVAKQSEEVAKRMSELGFASIQTKDDFRSLIEGMKVTDEASAKTFASLLSVSQAFATVADYSEKAAQEAIAMAQATAQAEAEAAAAAANAAAKAAANAQAEAAANAQAEADAAANAQAEAAANALSLVDVAFSALQRSINAQKALLQEQANAASTSLQNIQSIFDLLNGALKTMQPMARSTAQGILQSALAQSNAGASLANFPGLKDALQTVAKPSEQLFATFQDYQYDQQVTANTIAALRDNAGAQVSVAQMTLDAINSQIKSLDDIVGRAQMQIDAINGVDNSVVSVQSAVKSLADAIANVNKTVQPSSAATSSFAPSLSSTDSLSAIADYGSKYGGGDNGGAYYFMPGVNDYASKVKGAEGLVKALGAYDPAKYGTVEDAIFNSTGHTLAYWKDMQNQFDLGLHPTTKTLAMDGSHEGGLDYVPFNGYRAELHKGERVMTAKQSRDSDNIAGEIRKLQLQIDRLIGAADKTEGNTRRHADLFENVTEGGDAMRTTA